jgi:Rrf2 family protein
MILSMKTRYAMVAATYLAKRYGEGTILSKEIAEKENIPQRFLENILNDLKKTGIIGSKMGKSGGYYLLRKPSEISLLDIVRHFEGTIALIYCVSEKAYKPCEFCKDEATCKIRLVFKDIRDTTFDTLNQTTLDRLI